MTTYTKVLDSKILNAIAKKHNIVFDETHKYLTDYTQDSYYNHIEYKGAIYYMPF